MEAEKFHLRTVEDYLDSENDGEVRHEYLNGTVHAMSGASRRHNVISLSITGILRRKLAGGPCQTYMIDVKVRVGTIAGDFFYYPDVMVGCDPGDGNDYYLERPTILFEVTSPSTEQTDRREKPLAYQSLPSLEHYVIVSQHESSLLWFRRADEGWEKLLLTAPADCLEFTGQGISLALSEIYEGVEFD